MSPETTVEAGYSQELETRPYERQEGKKRGQMGRAKWDSEASNMQVERQAMNGNGGWRGPKDVALEEQGMYDDGRRRGRLTDYERKELLEPSETRRMNGSVSTAYSISSFPDEVGDSRYSRRYETERGDDRYRMEKSGDYFKEIVNKGR